MNSQQAFMSISQAYMSAHTCFKILSIVALAYLSISISAVQVREIFKCPLRTDEKDRMKEENYIKQAPSKCGYQKWTIEKVKHQIKTRKENCECTHWSTNNHCLRAEISK